MFQENIQDPRAWLNCDHVHCWMVVMFITDFLAWCGQDEFSDLSWVYVILKRLDIFL